MKLGLRKTSLKGMISSRTSVKRIMRNKLRVPNGMGIISNPRKAVYNKTYNKTTFSMLDILKKIFK